MNLYVSCSIIYNSQDLEAAQVSISRWVDLNKQTNKLWYIYMMEYYLGIKKEGNFTLGSSIDGHGEHSKWNKPTRKDKYCGSTHILNLMNKMK